LASLLSRKGAFSDAGPARPAEGHLDGDIVGEIMTAANVALARIFTEALGSLRPVAVSYLDAPPQGVDKFSGTVPSGCSFWRLAIDGPGFYTVPADHFNCPIGSYTHAIDLPAGRAAELDQMLSLMAGIGYVRMEEVPAIPRLDRQPACIYYAPLAAAVVRPDVVIFAGRPGPLMRLQEAAAAAGATSTLPLLGRPTCMALPAAMSQGAVMSSACIGNRVYTGLGDDELYLMLPGTRLTDVAGQLAQIIGANDTLAEHHRGRQAALSATGDQRADRGTDTVV
jgi:uncharacterized protein (DUF169 family)